VLLDEYDIDGNDRIFTNYVVDMGADEVSCFDVYNELDFSADGLVNLKEFSYFSAAWDTIELTEPNLPTDPNDPDYYRLHNWNEKCDLVADGIIDISDLAVFAGDWLWQACWRDGGMWQTIGAPEGMMESMAAGSAAMPLQTTTEPAIAAVPVTEPEPESEPEPEVPVEPQPEVSSDTLVEIIDFLDEVLADQPDNAENIEDMRVILIDELEAILEQ